jgi:hypothetical protein
MFPIEDIAFHAHPGYCDSFLLKKNWQAQRWGTASTTMLRASVTGPHSFKDVGSTFLYLLGFQPLIALHSGPTPPKVSMQAEAARG